MADLITIVDKDDNVIGSKERKEVYKDGDIHRLIKILVFNDQGELLLQWRSKNEDTFPETWDQSAGGHVDAGEDYITAAKRELNEELGIEVEKFKELDKFFIDGRYGEKIIRRFNTIYSVSHNGPFKLQESEVEKVKWWNVEELKSEVANNPEKFTHGMKDIVNNYL
ncbi:MAG: NUDIX domain-containing protein [Candidatus Dojkabacteria bacterium]|nr:NUDIX domain-containing protein [Candidatus Dojkabacteria bacterium]MDQ7020668.1 NUDIX domain-containing protein [Candidatus Dojkabacteria bacterium]